MMLAEGAYGIHIKTVTEAVYSNPRFKLGCEVEIKKTIPQHCDVMGASGGSARPEGDGMRVRSHSKCPSDGDKCR